MQSRTSSVLTELDCNLTNLSPRPTMLDSSSSSDQTSCPPSEEHKSEAPCCSDVQDDDDSFQAGHGSEPDLGLSGKGTIRSPAAEIPFTVSNFDLVAELTDNDFLFDGPEMPLNPQNTPETRGGKVSPLLSNKSLDRGYQSSPLAEPTALAWLTDIFENYNDDSIIQDGIGSIPSQPHKPTCLFDTEIIASNSPANSHVGPATQSSQDSHQPCQKSCSPHTTPPSTPNPTSTHIQFKDQAEVGHETESVTSELLKKPSIKIKTIRRHYLARRLRRASLKSLRTSSKDPGLSLESRSVPGFVWYGRLWGAPSDPRATGGLTDGAAISESLKQIGRSFLPLLEELEKGPLFGWSLYHCQMWIILSHEEDAGRAQNSRTYELPISLHIPALLLYVFFLTITASLSILSLSLFSGILGLAHQLLSRVSDIVFQALETIRTDSRTHMFLPFIADCPFCPQRSPRVDLSFELKRVR